jgi:hypothetical protein
LDIAVEQQLKRAAWIRGDLDYLVLPHQEEVWSAMKVFAKLASDYNEPTAIAKARKENTLTMNISRRFGKTTLSILLLISLCIRNPKHTYYFVAPTEGDARDIVDDVTPVLLEDCPKDLAPKIKGSVFLFNNGARIKIGGTFNGAEGLRGRSANGIIVDEAAHIPQHSKTSCLSYVLGSILTPQLMTTKGFLIIASTPPRNLQHDYVHIIRNAQYKETLLTFDVYANTSLTPEEIENEKERSYAIDPTGSAWKREWLVLLVPDANDLIIPEDTFNKVLQEQVNHHDIPHFHHLQRYIAFDHGTKDLNVILFAFYDYANARTVIEKELVLKGGPNTDTIAKEIAKAKKDLWGELPVFRSICDSISRQIIIDLNCHDEIKGAGIVFINPSKVDLEAMVNQLIVAISQGKYVIDQSCAMLIETLKTGTWKTSDSTGKRQFARLGEIGHCDALACLVYLQRGLIRSINPLLNAVMIDVHNQFVTTQERPAQGIEVFAKALKGIAGFKTGFGAGFGRRK